MTVVVKRSALKMWLMALGGIPLLVIALDVLTNRRIANYLREILFRPEETQIYEPRDVIWAWVMLGFAAFVILWGLKELFVPTKVIECRPEGLALKIRGPFRGPAVVPWKQVVDVDRYEMEEEGRKFPHLLLEFTTAEGLPDEPWGARWVGETWLAVLAEDWSDDPMKVAEQIADYAVAQARVDSRDAVRSIWSDSSADNDSPPDTPSDLSDPDMTASTTTQSDHTQSDQASSDRAGYQPEWVSGPGGAHLAPGGEAIGAIVPNPGTEEE